MKKLFYTLSMCLATSGLLVGMSACSDDDDDPIIPSVSNNSYTKGIYGTWGDENGNVVYTFNTDGTGVRSIKMFDSTGAISVTQYFTYTYDEEKKRLCLYIKGDDEVLIYTVQMTGNVLMLEQRDTIWILHKR